MIIRVDELLLKMLLFLLFRQVTLGVMILKNKNIVGIRDKLEENIFIFYYTITEQIWMSFECTVLLKSFPSYRISKILPLD